MPALNKKKKAILALLLLVPVSSIGVIAGLVWFPDTLLGSGVFAVCKLYLFGLPVIWHRFVDKERISYSPARHGGFRFGLLSGILISGAILLAYLVLGPKLFDRSFLIEKLSDAGLTCWPVYVGCSLYWILMNSVLEEYVWRWFVVKKCEVLFSPSLAIICSALFFTLHHIAAMRVYFGFSGVIIGSVGIFLGGAIWSFMYQKYRSIWPGYLSHAIVDICLFATGAVIIFG